MTVLELELWTALYILLGIAYFMYQKSLIDEALDDNDIGRVFVAGCFVVFWPIIVLIEITGFIYYLVKGSSE